MFKTKVKIRGGALISEGMNLLTKATDSIQQGIIDNSEDIDENAKSINILMEVNKNLLDENEKHLKIVDNFRKNILGETDEDS